MPKEKNVLLLSVVKNGFISLESKVLTTANFQCSLTKDVNQTRDRGKQVLERLAMEPTA